MRRLAIAVSLIGIGGLLAWVIVAHRNPPTSRTVPWRVTAHRPRLTAHARRTHPVRLSPTSMTIPIWVSTGYCLGGGRPRLGGVDVSQTADAVTITAHLDTSRVKHDYSQSCAGVGLTLGHEVHLRRPLGDRVLLDGRTSPLTRVPITRPVRSG